MKKMYLIFSLLLMILGINTATASVNLGNPVTDPATLKAGSKIIVYANRMQNETEQTHKFIASLGDSLLWATTNLQTIDPYTVFELVAAEGKTVAGKPAFYLKNSYNNKFLTYIYIPGDISEGGSVGDDGSGFIATEMSMTFTADQTKAMPVHITTQVEGAKIMNFTGEGPTEQNCLMFLAEFPENKDQIIAFNCAFARPSVANYADWATWWQVAEAAIAESYIDDLTAMYTKVESIKYKGGNNPGCYPAEMVQAYDKAKEDARVFLNEGGNVTEEGAKPLFLALEKAYIDLVAGKPAPVVEGYYRFVSGLDAFVQQQGETAIKTLFADVEGKMLWDDLKQDDANMVWKLIDRKNGSFLMYNVGTGQYVNAAKSTGTSSPYTMTSDSTDCGVTFKYLDQSAYNIMPGKNGALHTAGHGGGSGKNGNIVAWNSGLQTGSAWYVESVDASLIPGFEAIGQQNVLNRNLNELYKEAKAKYDIGSSFEINTDSTKYLVTAADFAADPNVIISNQDHNSLNESPDGDGYAALVDNDMSTFWHATWGSGRLPNGEGYLQFKLNKPVSAIAALFTRRPNQPNAAKELNFYVTNDTTKADSWTFAGSIKGLPEGAVGVAATDTAKLTTQTGAVNFGQEYQYVRIYWKSNSGFTHFTGFNLEEATLKTTCQNATMGAPAKNLADKLTEVGALLATGKATQAAIDELKAVYEAYKAELADPTELKELIKKADNFSKIAASPEMKKHNSEELAGFEEGAPGVYSEANKATLAAAVAEAQQYITDNDAQGTYTKEGVKTAFDKLTAAFDAFKATAGKIVAADATQDGIWYNITYSQRYFDITGNTPNTHGEGENQQIRKGALYVAADVNNDKLNGAQLKVTGHKTLADLNVADDYAKWRFINLGDTAYAIQNKATGLYIGANARLNMTPAAFKAEDLGYATFLLNGVRLDGESVDQLHVQTNGQLLVTWPNKELGGGSCFDLNPTKEVANNVARPDFKAEEVIKGRLYIKCYPLAIELVTDELNPEAYPYQIASVNREKNELTLTQNMDEIAAGQPFFYIAGGNTLGVNQEPTAADTTVLKVTLADKYKEIAKDAKTVNGLIGNYYGGKKVAKGFGVIKETKGVQSIDATKENQQIGGNSGYINIDQIAEGAAGEIVVPMTGDLGTSIQNAIIDAQTGLVNVYSIDGVLIKKNVKVSNATKGLAKGIYVVGNQKVAVQ